MPARQLHIEGIVQGVGFRPHVYRLATAYELKGWVSNDVAGVHIEVSGEKNLLDQFEDELLCHPPLHARIQSVTRKEVPEKDYITFQIIESNTVGTPTVLLTPDLGLCPSCRQEIEDPANNRTGYAFTTCLHCGPRYSIITGLPYDRPNTTMATFTLCPLCEAEYTNPLNRRYYSQTNSCPRCAVQLSLIDTRGATLALDPAVVIHEAVRHLSEGKILAVKGIGGYMLMADATNAFTVQTLRERKHRPAKPFAILFKSIEAAHAYVEITEQEASTLQSLESPVVLLRRKQPESLPGVAPGLDRLGVMLPYTPLLALLAEAFPGPLIATSGNVSGSPIYYDDQQAIENLKAVADYFVVNNRPIVIPQDDSVIQFTRFGGQRIILRRSRGLAPTVFNHPFTPAHDQLAMGADMKSAFALFAHGNLYASQYLGDLENFDTQTSYQHTLNHITQLVEAKPREILADLHPGYYSTQAGQKLAELWNVPLTEIQHHQAHLCAVLAENKQLDSTEPILGVIWDGTGLGNDGQIWGGEFFTYADHHIERVDHLPYFAHILGDKFSREPRLCALALTLGHREADTRLESKFTATEWKLYRALANMPNLQTSSVGRLFDGVASLLDLCDHTSYEGEAALLLETCAQRTHDRLLEPMQDFSTDGIIAYVLHQRKIGSHRSAIAYQFHVGLAAWIKEVAHKHGCRKIAFSGGVFQNALLVDLISGMLGDDHTLLFHHELSPNDESIAYGQLAYRQVELRSIQNSEQNETSCASPFPVK